MFVLRSSCFFVLAATAMLAPATTAFAQEKPQPRRAPAEGDRALVAAIPHRPVAQLTEQAVTLPPPPADATDLKFAEFFQTPVGPRGLETTERLRELAGRKVRLVGYFVFEDWGSCSCPPGTEQAGARPGRPAPPAWMKHVVPGRIMLAPRPVSVSLGHYGLCDDLPPQTAYLHIASRFGEPVFFRPGLHAITGTLELGNRDEQDGRVSAIRLRVERDNDVQAVGRALASTASAPAAAPQDSSN